MSEIRKQLQNAIGTTIQNEYLLFTSWLGCTLLTVEEGEIRAEFVVRPEMCNPSGLLHGGIHAAIMDDMVGMTVAAHGLKHLFVSINLSVDFLASAKAGDTVVAHAKLIRVGKTIVNAEATIHNKEGKLLSKATTNMANTGIVVG